MLIYRDFTFDSAHVLSDFSKDHPYGKIHGHSFRARIWIEGEINETNKALFQVFGYRESFEKVSLLIIESPHLFI